MQRFSPEKFPRQFDDDKRQINRIVRLVDDMLNVSRIQTGKLILLGDEFDFREMVRDTLSSLIPQLELQGCQVTLDARQEVCGIWDRFRIEQVFINWTWALYFKENCRGASRDDSCGESA